VSPEIPNNATNSTSRVVSENASLKLASDPNDSLMFSSEPYMDPKQVQSVTTKLVTLQNSFDLANTKEFLNSAAVCSNSSSSKALVSSIHTSDGVPSLIPALARKSVSPNTPTAAKPVSLPTNSNVGADTVDVKPGKNPRTKPTQGKPKKSGEKRPRKSSKTSEIVTSKKEVKAQKNLSPEHGKHARIETIESPIKKQPTKLIIKPLTAESGSKVLADPVLAKPASLQENSQWLVDSGSTVIPDIGRSDSLSSNLLEQKELQTSLDSMLTIEHTVYMNQSNSNGKWSLDKGHSDIRTPTLQELQLDALSPPEWNIKDLGPVDFSFQPNHGSGVEPLVFLPNNFSKRRYSDDLSWLPAENVPILTPVLSQNAPQSMNMLRSGNDRIDFQLNTLQSPLKKSRTSYFPSQTFANPPTDTHPSLTSLYTTNSGALGADFSFSFATQPN
jgi:hypothetical protein